MKYSPEVLAAPKSDRYRIAGLLGRGATSLVYKAFDLEKKFVVALKTVRFPEQDGIYQLKQEFRSFRDFYHPNIVELYDLYVGESSCFYTMELVEGSDFVSFVRSRDNLLRSCLGQLVDGLAAVHDSGRLHRDLKPSNILVEETGRTVLLDFGLAGETRSTDSILTQSHLFGGTPAYMAPERLAGEPATEASDLYALGVILYQALAGRRPYPDSSPLARHEAQKTPPPDPHEVAPGAPKDLGELTLRLLSFDPEARPLLAEVKRLAQYPQTRTHSGQRILGSLNHPFVGRRAELSRLQDALARTLSGRRVTTHVSGVSGVGKTTLIERFLVQARDEVGAMALRSRCHHQESVRFNAVDGLIDMLSRHLVAESEERLKQIVPDDLPALVTMFPVLGRISWPALDFDQDNLSSDPQSLVRQGLGALRRLFRQIAAGRPLILWIDDLQWSDAGSLPLLLEIAGVGGDKPILTIFSYRSEDVQPNSVAAILETETMANPDIEIERILVQPLDASSVGALAQSLVDSVVPCDSAWARELTQLSGGLPFFVLQLASYRRFAPNASVESMNAADILDSRFRSLPSLQRTILEIVAVAGRPLAEETLVRMVVGESASGREIYRLLNQNLLRRVDMNGRGAVETYHDRIRAAVLHSLEPQARRLRHRRIAEEMARAKEIDHPLLVEHFLGAGEDRVASEHAILAARAAKERLAFHQAAEFLLLASRLRNPLEDDAALLAELASALADAGRSSEAADLFLQVARANNSNERTVALFEARAAHHLLYSGRLSEGQALCRKLFTDLGIAFPKTVRDALRMSTVNRALFAIGVKPLKMGPTEENGQQALMRVDTLWAAAKGFLMLDYVVGDAMFTRFMREAAALGEPSRVLRALALEAAVMANVGRPWSMRRAESLLRRAERHVGDTADPYDRVVVRTCEAGVFWHRGCWRDAAELAREAIELHRRDCGRYDFEVSIARAYRGSALTMQGLIRQAKSETLEAIDDARARGDVYVSRFFRSSYYVYVALAEDSPDAIIADSPAVLDDLPSDRFTSLHWSHFLATANALAYADRPWDAWALVQKQWPLIRDVRFLKLGCIGAQIREIRARVALTAAAAGSPPPSFSDWTREQLLRLADEDADAIGRTKTLSHAAATTAAIRSGIAGLRGDHQRRRRLLESATRGFAEAGMALHQAAAELQLAALALDKTASEAASAWRTMADEGVTRPERLSAFLMFAH